MRILVFSVLFALAASTTLCAHEMYAPTFAVGAPAGTIQGFVLGSDTKPIGGAEIVAIATPRPGYQGLFADDPTGPTLSATSDSEGKFTLHVTRDRPFELRVRTSDGRIGYVPTCQPREIVTVRVAPPAEIEIELVDAAAGKPVAGVEVAASWTETSLLRQFISVPHRITSARTDASGRALLTNLAPGPIDIVYEPSTQGLSPARAWRVLAGEKSRLRVRATEPRRTFEGRVTDRAGNPVPGARVAVNMSFDHFTIADDEGKFEITSFIPLGEFWLFVQADGFALEQRQILDFDSPMSGLLIALAPGRAVSGRFVDGAGQAQAGVPFVVVHDPFTNVPDQVRGTSNVDGSFHVPGLRVDVKHVLVAWSAGHALCVRSLGDVEFGAPDLALGELVLTRESILEGRFVDGDDKPIVRAEISCAMTPVRNDAVPEGSATQPLDMPIGARKTDADGRFRFDGLFAGGATFTGLAQNTMKRETTGIGAAAQRSDVVIRPIAPLRKADATHGEVGGEIAARVVLADGRSAARAAVDLLPEDEGAAPIRAGFTDEDGSFQFTELHGARYRLDIHLRDGFADSTPLRARRRLSPEELTAVMGAPASSSGRSITLNEVVLVAGRVVDPEEPDGRPWFVRAVPSGPLGSPTSVSSDEHGHFTFAMEVGVTMTLWLSPLNRNPGVPRSALNAHVVEPFPVRDLKVGSQELVIQVP